MTEQANLNSQVVPDGSNPSEEPSSSQLLSDALAYLHDHNAELLLRNDGHVYIEVQRHRDGLRVQASGHGVVAAAARLRQVLGGGHGQ